jgi:hypothetical protein
MDLKVRGNLGLIHLFYLFYSGKGLLVYIPKGISTVLASGLHIGLFQNAKPLQAYATSFRPHRPI